MPNRSRKVYRILEEDFSIPMQEAQYTLEMYPRWEDFDTREEAEETIESEGEDYMAYIIIEVFKVG